MPDNQEHIQQDNNKTRKVEISIADTEIKNGNGDAKSEVPTREKSTFDTTSKIPRKNLENWKHFGFASPEEEQEASLKNGRVIGSYQVLRLIKYRGICETYVVKDILTNKKFILKLLPPSRVMDDEYKDRFKSAIGDIRDHIHTGVAHTRDLGSEGDLYYVITDYIQGTDVVPLTLEDWVNYEGKMPELQVKKIALQICEALQHAHSNRYSSYTHNDLKPSNILFDKDQHVMITDFITMQLVGHKFIREVIKFTLNQKRQTLSELDSDEQSKVKPEKVDRTLKINLKPRDDSFQYFISLLMKYTGIEFLLDLFKKQQPDAPVHNQDPAEEGERAESVIETYDYMSPEQKTGEPATPQSNIYSMGLIIYRMLTGRKITGGWDLPSQLGCNPAWDAIIIKCLQPKPEARYQAMEKLAKDIQTVNNKNISPVPLYAIAAIFVFVFGAVMYEYRDHLIVIPKSDKVVPKVNENQRKPVVPVATGHTDKPESFLYLFNVRPAGAGLKIYRPDKTQVHLVKALRPSGVKFELKPGKYMVEVDGENCEPFKTELELDDQEFEVMLEPQLHDLNGVKTYSFLKNLKNPRLGFPWVVPDLNIVMLPIDPGVLPGGAPATGKTISRTFWIAKFEITQKQYKAIMWKNPSLFEYSINNPVDNISWNDAMEFCRRLTEREAKAKRLMAGYEYRLPTEVEWEYVCRAGSEDNPNFEKNIKWLRDHAWFVGNSKESTYPPGMKPPNPWGIYDMQGNVAEWCLNADDVTETSDTDTNNELQDSKYVLRGGSWKSLPDECSFTAKKEMKTPEQANPTCGFRVVMAPVSTYSKRLADY